jgi:hypothetical protein
VEAAHKEVFMTIRSHRHGALYTVAHQPKVVLRDATVTGLLGAATIMVWFLALDSIAGRPLFTPTVLGSVLVGSAERPSADLAVSLPIVGLYTVVHTLAFCVVGWVATWFFAIAEKNPGVIFGLLLALIFFLCGFVALTMLAAPAVLELVSPFAILTGNLLAVLAMGRFLWRRHPVQLSGLL